LHTKTKSYVKFHIQNKEKVKLLSATMRYVTLHTKTKSYVKF